MWMRRGEKNQNIYILLKIYYLLPHALLHNIGTH